MANDKDGKNQESIQEPSTEAAGPSTKEVAQAEPISAPSVRLAPGLVNVIPAAIAKGIVAIQAEVAPLTKTAENPHFKNSYVPLSEVMREALQLLSKHGMGITQWPITHGEKTFLITILMHESGASIQGEQELLLARKDSQGQGSSLTYARRYGIMAILGLVGDDDDDGNKAANQRTKPTPDQISEIRQLCVDLKYSPDQAAARIASLRTEDQATVALANLHKNMEERATRLKGEAAAIPVFTGDRTQKIPMELIPGAETSGVGDTVVDNLNKHLMALPLTAEHKRKLVLTITGKPFLKNCTQEELTLFAEKLDAIREGIKNGTYNLVDVPTDGDIAPPEQVA